MPHTSRRAASVALARRHPLVLVAAGIVLYATGPVFGAASDATGPVFSFWRLWFGVGVLGLATAVAVRLGGAAWPSLRHRQSRQRWRYAVWGGIAFGLHQLCIFTAVKATSVTDVSLMSTLSPVIVALAAIPIFGERPGSRFRVWTLLAMAGAVVVILGGSTGPEGDPFGMALAIANVGFFAAFFLVSKQSRGALSVLPFLLGVMVVAGLTVTGYVVVAGDPVTAVTRRDLALALAVAVGPGAVGHFVMTWPLRWVAANVPPLMRLAQPAIAGFLAWVWLGEPVLGTHLLGGALTIAGVAGALTSRGGRALWAGEGEPGGQPSG